jgi:hypothetical protein
MEALNKILLGSERATSPTISSVQLLNQDFLNLFIKGTDALRSMVDLLAYLIIAAQNLLLKV